MPVATNTPVNGREDFLTDKGLLPISVGINILGSIRMAIGTDKAPIPMSVGANTLVNGEITQ